MRKINIYHIITIFVVAILPVYTHAQSPATINEYQKTFTTYPFSDPNPVPNPTNVYPYFRYDGFTDQPIQKKWKVVELENDFIKVLITPQIGGKIWTAIDKKNDKPFIYNNDVVKFRDIAMRGPWTSGGIEINYGIFGHTPGVATPVNYITRENPDGSASCILSLLDLLTGTRWCLEVRLPKDKAYFITKSFWHNGSGIYQPYYTWMNMAQKVSDSLEFIFPGNHYIGHDGSVHNWPYNEKANKNISIYNQNNFGGSKSYHVTGVYSKYFGAYWQKEDYGMMHYAPRQDKIGKKIFIWGLAESGMIWEDILTDHAGQYTEMQSGRLYNQNAPESVQSPFKQFFFMPYNTDTWNEYWYPFQNTEGVIYADLNGVFNIERNNNTATLFISSVSYINDSLKIFNQNKKIIYQGKVNLSPLQTFQKRISLGKRDSIGLILLSDSRIQLHEEPKKTLDRPLKSPGDFDWNSGYGLYLKGEYAAGTKHFDTAEKYIRKSLTKNPYFVPALTQMSYLQYRKMNYDSAFYYVQKALSINTYAPAANYYYGLAAMKLNKRYDALDGFQIAAITPQFRSAAYTELSKMSFQNKQYKKADKYATKSLVNNTKNITALQLKYLSNRFLKKEKSLNTIKERIINLDPLNHFIRFEKYWKHKTGANKRQFTALIKDELPQQTYLYLANWYIQLNLNDEAEAVLQTAPRKDNEIAYWLAYLHKNDQDAETWLRKANAGNPKFVFPYMPQSAVIMRWATKNTDNWKPKYYLALILHERGHEKEALKLLTNIKDTVQFAPFYVTRARWQNFSQSNLILDDYQKAASLNNKDWRYAKYLGEYLLSIDKEKKALEMVSTQFKADKGNYIIGMLFVRCLMQNKQYQKAEKVLSRLHILPYEGARDGHKLFKQIKLLLALQQLQKQHYKTALQKVKESKKWPTHLGVGKPYRNKIDTALQDSIINLIKESKQTNQIPKAKIKTFKRKIQENI